MIENIGMAIYECPRIEVPLEPRINMRGVEMDALGRKRNRVFIAKLGLAAENKRRNYEESRNQRQRKNAGNSKTADA